MTPIPRLHGYYINPLTGVVVSMKNGRPYRMRQRKQAGYTVVSVNNRNIRIHRVLCEIFHGPAPTPDHETRHLNGIRSDNREINLAWGTRKENAADRKIHGTETCGERNGRSKLTAYDVRWIRRLRATGKFGLFELSMLFGVSDTVISHIEHGKRWRHVAELEKKGGER